MSVAGPRRPSWRARARRRRAARAASRSRRRAGTRCPGRSPIPMPAHAAASLLGGLRDHPSEQREVLLFDGGPLGQRLLAADPRCRRADRPRGSWSWRPGDIELLAEPVEDAADERVVAGPAVGGVGGGLDPSLGVGGDRDRRRRRVEVEPRAPGSLPTAAIRADRQERRVLRGDPVAGVLDQLVRCRDARNQAAFRRLPNNPDRDCQSRSLGPAPVPRRPYPTRRPGCEPLRMPRSYSRGQPTVPSRYRSVHGAARTPARIAPRRRGQPAGRADLGEPRRAPAPRGDGAGRVRRAALPGRAAAAGRRLGRRRLGDGLPDAAQRGRGAALDRGRQGGSAPARAPRRHRSRVRRIRALGRPRRRDRAALEALVTEINAAIARLNAEAPTDRQHRRPLDVADELATFDAALDAARRSAARDDLRIPSAERRLAGRAVMADPCAPDDESRARSDCPWRLRPDSVHGQRCAAHRTEPANPTASAGPRRWSMIEAQGAIARIAANASTIGEKPLASATSATTITTTSSTIASTTAGRSRRPRPPVVGHHAARTGPRPPRRTPRCGDRRRAVVVAGDISAMLWNGVISTPRFIAHRWRNRSRSRSVLAHCSEPLRGGWGMKWYSARAPRRATCHGTSRVADHVVDARPPTARPAAASGRTPRRSGPRSASPGSPPSTGRCRPACRRRRRRPSPRRGCSRRSARRAPR